MNTVYRAGSWFALIGPRAVVALPPDSAAALVERLWERIEAADVAFSDVVDALTSAGGGSFAAIPPFAAVVREGEDARIAVRGRVLARVLAAGGEQEITGAEVTTWSERFVPAVTGVQLRVEDEGEDPALPIVAGVVRAASIALGAAASPPAPSVEDAAASPSGSLSEDVAASSSAPLSEDVAAASPSGSLSEDAAGDRDETPSLPDSSEPSPADGAVPAASATTASPGIDGIDGIDDEADDTVLSVPAPVETILPPADTVAAPLGGHTLDFAPAAASIVQTPSPDRDGDHDGATISLAQARALRGDPAADRPAAVPAAVMLPTEPLSVVPVLPVLPDPLPAAPVSSVPGITAPGLAEPQAPAGPGAVQGPRIRLSTGQVVALDRTVVIGRRPRATRSSGATLPHLVAVDSPQQDISRSHLEIRPEPDAVVVLDLHTTNGSTLLRPGKDPVRLHPGEQTIVVSGDVIDLGDGVSVAFEELP